MYDFKKILSIIFNIFILFGLSWQVYEVSSLFFRFDVLTHLDINFDETIYTPDMSVCITYYDVLDIREFNEMTNSSLDPSAMGEKSIEQFDYVQSKITIKQLFQLTPEEDESIKSCFLRDPNTYQFNIFGSTQECNNHFQAEKYSFMDSICYRFSHEVSPNETFTKTSDHHHQTTLVNSGRPNYNTNLVYTKRDIVYSPDDPGLIFTIKLADSLNNSNKLRIMMHPINQFPWIEAAYTSEEVRSLDTDGKATEKNLFSATSSRITVKKLPPPYISNCRDYASEGLKDVFACRQSCYRKKILERFDKMPFNSRVTNALDKKRVCAEDIRDRVTRLLLVQYQRECMRKCLQDDCYTVITTTDVESAKYEEFTVIYKTPIKPSLVLRSNVRLSFTEFIVYVTSCFGIWLGVSVYHSNPFKNDLFEKVKNPSWFRRCFDCRAHQGGDQPVTNVREVANVLLHPQNQPHQQQLLEQFKGIIVSEVYSMVIARLSLDSLTRRFGRRL